MQALTPAHVQAELDRLNTGITIRFFENTTATSQQAADNIGCELGQIVKSIAFMVDGRPIVVLTSGDQLVDDRKIALLHEVGRKKVKIATAEQLINLYGYPPGSVPPLAYRTPDLPVYLDDSLKRFSLVYAAGGAHNAIFPVPLAQLAEITSAPFVDVVKAAG
ncbi:MAG: YbaK/EbsC family protein [Anaerolineae bacterium]|nr:YbaK/EbsC family protein [Anaerolineae bacterium]